MTGDAAPPLIAIVGPTAAGKSAFALALAHRIGGEIVNADAMQLYVGMDIGTAKLPVGQRESVPHHLLDVWSIGVRASVVDYQRRAVEAVEDIHRRSAVPIVVGGSGLYVRALIDDLKIPPTDPAVRDRLERELDDTGPAAMHDRLRTVDPAAAANILASNGRRIVRALEVVELAGSFSATLPDGTYRWPGTVQVGLDPPDLDARIESRVGAMFAAGLVAEVRELERAGLRESPTAGKALGYAQVMADADPVTAASATALATRRFARRQRSWFRRDRRIRWGSNIDQETLGSDRESG